MSLRPIKKILCPVDFSEFSLQTALEAFQQAAFHDADLVLVNVVNERAFYELERLGGRVGELREVADRAIGSMEEERVRAMRALLSRLHENGAPHEGVRHSSRIVVGAPWERILDLAEEEQADLIVMGAKGHGAPARSLRFGSTAEKVFRRATCRVLFLR